MRNFKKILKSKKKFLIFAALMLSACAGFRSSKPSSVGREPHEIITGAGLDKENLPNSYAKENIVGNILYKEFVNHSEHPTDGKDVIRAQTKVIFYAANTVNPVFTNKSEDYEKISVINPGNEFAVYTLDNGNKYQKLPKKITEGLPKDALILNLRLYDGLLQFFTPATKLDDYPKVTFNTEKGDRYFKILGTKEFEGFDQKVTLPSSNAKLINPLEENHIVSATLGSDLTVEWTPKEDHLTYILLRVYNSGNKVYHNLMGIEDCKVGKWTFSKDALSKHLVAGTGFLEFDHAVTGTFAVKSGNVNYMGESGHKFHFELKPEPKK